VPSQPHTTKYNSRKQGANKEDARRQLKEHKHKRVAVEKNIRTDAATTVL